MTEKFAENFNIKVPKSLLVFLHSYSRELLNNFDCPIIIKPNYESESIGITQNCIVSDTDQADHIVNQLFDLEECVVRKIKNPTILVGSAFRNGKDRSIARIVIMCMGRFTLRSFHASAVPSPYTVLPDNPYRGIRNLAY